MRFLIIATLALSLSAQTYTRKTICAAGCDYLNTASGLQTAVNDAATAQGGSCAPYLIDIDPANVLDLLGNSITLPAKTCAQWVRIRSMQMGSLPADGTRVDTTSSALARIQSTMGSAQYFRHFQGPNSRTRYWAFEGLDLYGNTTNGEYGSILQLGDTASGLYPASSDPGRRADHFEVKHCWIHGVIGRLNVTTGIGIDANNVLIADSVVEDIANSAESHALSIGWTDGPVDLINNNFDASTITTLVGGSIDPAGLIPTFIHYTGNKYSRKGWYKHLIASVPDAPTYPCRPGNVHRTTVPEDWVCSGGAPGTWTNTGRTDQWATGAAQKNVWEQKTGRGSRIYGNDFSGGWLPSGQGAEIFVMNLVASTTSDPATYAAFVQPASPNGGTTYSQPWTTITDFSFIANNMHDSIAAWSFAFPVNQATSIVGVCAAGGVSSPPWCLPNAHNNIRMYNNLVTNMSDQRDYYGGGVGSGQGNGFVTSQNIGSFNIDFRHNTYLASTTTVDSGWMNNQLINDGSGGEYGYANVRDNIMPRSRNGYNQCGWNSKLVANGTSDLRGNMLITGGPWGNNGFTTGANCVADWPLGTQSAANNAAAVDGAFRVQPAYRGRASDGRDPGADVDHANYATAGAVSGTYNAALEYKLRGAMPTQTGVKIYFTANSTNACTWELSTNPDSFASPIGVTSQTRNGRDGIATWTGNLSAATAYFARATCDTFKLEHDVTGKRFMFITAP